MALTPTELVAKLTQRPFTFEEHPFPRLDPDTGEPVCQVGLRLLEQLAIQQCRTRALLAVQKDLGSDFAKVHGAENLYEDRVVVETLCAAMVHVDVEGHPQIFKDGVELAKALLPCEITELYQAWAEMQVRYMASEGDVQSEKHYTETFEMLKEGLRSYPFLPKRYSDVADHLLCASERVSSIYALKDCPSETWQTRLESLFKKWDSDTLCYTGLRVHKKGS